ncbi:MAG: dihydroorotase [Bacteroidales bacterium]|nr:dihydroorotase [Bacteroidales bacterium]MCF8390821.1 dihydroorotase [Bacteroidales bacterium]
MSSYLIKNALIVNNGKSFVGNLLTENSIITKISAKEIPAPEICEVIDASGLILIPGVIDDQVHFREPGLTHKGNIFSESRAAAAGGVTSYMEMPNTIPQAVNTEEFTKKFEIAANSSLVNYSFYFGATNDNISEIKKIDPSFTCGLKVFMGSSTGNMLVDNRKSLEAIFAESPVLIATHCEDETTIKRNTEIFREKYGENLPFKYHPEIRSTEACFLSSSLAVELANKFNSRLHILHISTAKELELFRNDIPATEKKITAEVCVHHLWFNEDSYNTKGSLIKWNPAVKKETDRKALFEAVLSGKLDVIATDHAPHTLEEKQNSYFKAPSGGPMVQHSLVSMLEFSKQGLITIEKIVEKMCHTPADIFHIDKRGYLTEGNYADMVLINPNASWHVEKKNILYKCGWSPLDGQEFSHSIEKTFVNGVVVFNNGLVIESKKAMALQFNH